MALTIRWAAKRSDPLGTLARRRFALLRLRAGLAGGAPTPSRDRVGSRHGDWSARRSHGIFVNTDEVAVRAQIDIDGIPRDMGFPGDYHAELERWRHGHRRGRKGQ